MFFKGPHRSIWDLQVQYVRWYNNTSHEYDDGWCLSVDLLRNWWWPTLCRWENLLSFESKVYDRNKTQHLFIYISSYVRLIYRMVCCFLSFRLFVVFLDLLSDSISAPTTSMTHLLGCGLKVPQKAAAGSGFGVSLWAITSAAAPWTWTHPDRFYFNLKPFQTFWPQRREMSLMIP